MSTTECRPYYKISKRTMREHVVAHLTGNGPWTVPGYLAHLGFTKGSLPGGGTIGILELGGGWIPADVAASFAAVGLPAPTLSDISIDGTQNAGANGGDASMEVALDIQVAGQVYAWLTGKPATIDMLWSSDIGTAALKSSELGHAACSCSWGADEPSWGAAGLVAMQAACVVCTDSGTTFCAASGDNDADDEDGTGKPSVDAPASCPNALACGGTSTPQNGPSVIWNNDPGNASGEGTGGGYSSHFPFQSFCSGPTGSGRMVSDVAGNADPNTGYNIVCMGQSEIVGGTSAVAPLWAGIIAAFGPKGQGLLAAKLWAAKATACTFVTSGTNGVYGADVCCGAGVPNGSGLVALLRGSAPPVPAPPTPAPTPTPSPTGPTLAQAQAALHTWLSGHWLLFKSDAIDLVNLAFSTLVWGSSPTLAEAEATVAKAFANRPVMIGGEAIRLADAALAALSW